jgi:pyridoxal phosphate enzyme (YggS family)
MIAENVKKVLKRIPEGVLLVAAVKERKAEEIAQAIDAGVTIVGENYVQEAEQKQALVERKALWHMLGHLQKNKVKKAVRIFDMIQTLDSLELGRQIDSECAKINKVMPVLIEINSAKEKQKSGVMPEELKGFIDAMRGLSHIRIKGLMTMGPFFDDPEDVRPFFKEAKRRFDEIKTCYKDDLPLQYLSMGMSDSYMIAIEEGATMVRIGRSLFGARKA